ncbi:cell division protein FtsA [Constrictibacter sp. MBR-5]|uniref:cell division protein FtsA n=1 Tax=Constrictibacter sp. MBR-5 TaxID=3156467 RepID=UPI00339217C3
MSKGNAKARSGLIAALDIGTTKCCCFVARPQADRSPRVVGIGHQESRGLRNGVIVDMEAAEATIINTIHAAEQMAGETVRQVVVNISGGKPASHSIASEVALSSHEVEDVDVRRALAQGRAQFAPNGREMVHFIPLGYTIDGNRGIRDPRGMFGEKLGVDMHVITAEAGPIRNIATCVGRAHLDVEAFVVSPYAAGLAALVEDEMDLGVTLIDMGGGTTGVSVFYDGSVVYTDTIPVGGAHVTNDIARGLSTPVNHAERLKTLYGSCMASATDEREIIDVPPIGEDPLTNPHHVPKSLLIGIIQPRIEEIFELVRSRLDASGFDRVAGRRVVLTGGASQLQGAREMAALALDKQVRIGRPTGVMGLAEATSGPAFATCAGLLIYAGREQGGHAYQSLETFDQSAGFLSRVGTWLREHM